MTLLQILDNVIFISFLGLVAVFVLRRFKDFDSFIARALVGVFFGLIAFLVTAAPVEFPDGATVDARAGPVVLAGVLAGPIGGLIAAAFGGLARGFVGGNFALSGIVAYFVYALIGAAINYLGWAPLCRISEPRKIGLLAFASVCGGGAMFFLISPRERAVQWLLDDFPFIVVANVSSVALASVVVGIAVQFVMKTKEVEELNETLKLAKSAGGFGVWDYDVKAGVIQWDDRSIEMHGLDRSEFSGAFEDWERNVHPNDLGSVQAEFAESLQHGGSAEAEYRVFSLDGKERIIKVSSIALCDSAGAVYRLIGTHLDLTPLRAAEAKIREAQSQALQSQKFDTIGQLTGGVAHDFNNLLAIIMGNQELLRAELLQTPPNVKEVDALVEASLEATRRGAELTQNMLAYARKAQLVPAEVDLNQAVRETEKWLRRTIEARIEIETVLQGGLWLTRLDRASLQNALVNLMVNARDAFDGSGQVTVETSNIRIEQDYIGERQEDIGPASYVMLAVTDNGSGISPEDLTRVFDPFYTTKPTGKGSGLGLSMVHGFVKQSGGAIRVYSELGVGTSFKLYFPAIRKETGDKPVGPAGGVSRYLEASFDGRILLVEDQPEVLAVLEKTLVGAGYDVVTAKSGDEAFGIFCNDGLFDLVATDIVMPGERQGPRLAKDIRAMDPDVPFIFLSGYASEATVHGNGLKPDDIRLMKPVSRETLLNSVQSIMQSKG